MRSKTCWMGVADMDIPNTVSDLYELLDQRYKTIQSCDKDMDSYRASNSEILTKLGIIQHTLDGYKWTFRTAGAAVIVAIITAVLALIIK